MRDTLAGIAIGASVGLLVGLSVSPIAGAVVTTLLSVLVAYLGLGGQAGSLTSGVVSARVVGFCLGLAPALLLSLTLRTHDGLSPSPLAQVERWKAAGFSHSEAKDLVVLERFGSLPPAPRITDSVSPKPGPKDEKESSGSQPSIRPPIAGPQVINPTRTHLFRLPEPVGGLDCEMVRFGRFDRVEDRLEAMSSRPAWGDVVGAARRLQGADAQAAHLEEQWRAKCGE
jgi:hypothetical protein